MSATLSLFERWKTAKGISSDRGAMAELGLSPGAAVHWRNGKNGEAHIVERMCKDLGEDPLPVILEAFAEAARDAEARRALQRLAKRFRGAAFAVALGALPLMVTSAAQARSCGLTSYSLCEHRSASRRLQGSIQHGRRFTKRRNPTWKPSRPASKLSA